MLETSARIEPCLFEENVPTDLSDLALEIQRSASQLGSGLHDASIAELRSFVQVMNAYYSNLIEGHNTRPREIEQALRGAELAPESRALALEAKAHVLLQRDIDLGGEPAEHGAPTSVDYLKWLHRRFYENMPAEYAFMELPDGRRRPIIPGAFRAVPQDDVAVGRHQPPSSERVDSFMDYFAHRYSHVRSRTNQIIAVAAAHHRFNYIHPFPDGNGRVSRLMSHTMIKRAGIGGGGLWSISRGLARGLADRSEYPQMLDLADTPRQGDLDGCGNLSERALRQFCEWFMRVALDQIQFTSKLFDFDRLEPRYRQLVRDVVDDKRAADLMSAVFRTGTLERGDASLVLRTSERTARATVSLLVRSGFLKSDTPKGPVRVAFPLDYRERLFPNLFVEAGERIA